MTSYVFSTTLRPADCPGATVSADPAETVRALKEQPGKAIWLFGGGCLFRSLLELGLVDEVQVGIVPVLLGDGLPLVEHPATLATLKLNETPRLREDRDVMLDYDVRART